MPSMTSLWVAGFLAVACVAPVRAEPLRSSFDLRVADAPHATRTDAGEAVFEELHLTSFAEAPLRLSRVDVVDAANGHVLASIAGAALEQRFALIGPAGPGQGAVVAPGRHGVVYLQWPTHGHHPRTIRHVVTYAALPAAATATVRGGAAIVSYDVGAPLGPPLRGGPWVAIHAAAWPHGHRRVFNAVDGKARIPGRFAVDWVRVDAAGRTAQGDPDVPGNALGYGAEVLAVAAATVVAVRDTMAESPRVSDNPKHTLDEDAGNYVTIHLDDGRYAFYEHLRPGSVAVRPGQRLDRGDVLGELGFTGASTGPHLHFHVADGPSTVASEGRPFVLEAFDLLGSYGDLGKLGKARWAPRPAKESSRRRDEWPVENAVVRFPD
ncbi:M23 family metallopeptidase [Frateuria sp. STR12]|uniref:M23 family metallopeptidase n=1 Tax=Frateuria hangzhouensis TaxID=2995589 RepID=UPI002260D1CD|nr:M23 family metallopeptidase [Frateuria sp. STR12]MCX7514898.1 M23 family metallopeptidase [Frateuria sp. STR12]